MWHSIAALLVSVIHALFVGWMLLAPFCGRLEQLLLYVIIVPFLYCHWLLNNDHCALTLLEQWLRGVSAEESFIHKIVSPIYLFMSGSDLSDGALQRCVYLITACLWVYAVIRVRRYFLYSARGLSSSEKP